MRYYPVGYMNIEALTITPRPFFDISLIYPTHKPRGPVAGVAACGRYQTIIGYKVKKKKKKNVMSNHRPSLPWLVSATSEVPIFINCSCSLPIFRASQAFVGSNRASSAFRRDHDSRNASVFFPCLWHLCGTRPWRLASRGTVGG